MEPEQKLKKPIWKKWWVWAIGIVLLIIIIGNSGASKTKPIRSATPPPDVVTTQTAVFDVPALIGKNLDEVTASLSPYQKKSADPTEQQIKLGAKTWDRTFEKDGKTLLVTYDILTKKIIDFFIDTDDPNGSTKDKNHLLALGGLKENDSKYKVEFVKAIKDPSVFTGIKITPQ